MCEMNFPGKWRVAAFCQVRHFARGSNDDTWCQHRRSRVLGEIADVAQDGPHEVTWRASQKVKARRIVPPRRTLCCSFEEARRIGRQHIVPKMEEVDNRANGGDKAGDEITVSCKRYEMS